MKRGRQIDSNEKEKNRSTLEEAMQQLISYPERPVQTEDVRTFPFRLFSFLDNSQYDNAIKWSSDGKAFG